MWAEKGGLDFEGRAKHDAWTALKGMEADTAKLEALAGLSREWAVTWHTCNSGTPHTRVFATNACLYACMCPPCTHRLRFVKLFYEFPPSCLYSDTRGGVTA
jgi:hypothetical protein